MTQKKITHLKNVLRISSIKLKLENMLPDEGIVPKQPLYR